MRKILVRGKGTNDAYHRSQDGTIFPINQATDPVHLTRGSRPAQCGEGGDD